MGSFPTQFGPSVRPFSRPPALILTESTKLYRDNYYFGGHTELFLKRACARPGAYFPPSCHGSQLRKYPRPAVGLFMSSQPRSPLLYLGSPG